MNDDLEARVRARILAIIHPNAAETEAEQLALAQAVGYQAAWEAEHADYMDALGRGVERFTAGDYSESYGAGTAGGRDGLCPDARAALFNAGLLRRSLPCARRI